MPGCLDVRPFRRDGDTSLVVRTSTCEQRRAIDGPTIQVPRTPLIRTVTYIYKPNTSTECRDELRMLLARSHSTNLGSTRKVPRWSMVEGREREGGLGAHRV